MNFGSFWVQLRANDVIKRVKIIFFIFFFYFLFLALRPALSLKLTYHRQFLYQNSHPIMSYCVLCEYGLILRDAYFTENSVIQLPLGHLFCFGQNDPIFGQNVLG